MNIKIISEFIANQKLPSIITGFSGGADSTALLLILEELSGTLGFSHQAIHFEHGLRAQESILDAGWCREFCEHHNIPYRQFSLNVPANRKSGESIEEAARRLRLEKWEEIIAENPETVVALAHHADDRAENVLLRLIRGANVSGLTSMRNVQRIGGVTYIRPLLAYQRQDLILWLKNKGIIDWRVDSSNYDNHYKRNFLRNKILPLIYNEIDFAEKGLQQSISTLATDASYIEQHVTEQFQKIEKKEKIPLPFLNEVHPAIRVRLLRRWLSNRLGGEFIPDKHLISRINKMLCSADHNSGESKLVPLCQNSYLQFLNGKLAIYQATELPAPELNPINWNWKITPQLSWLDTNFSLEFETADDSGQTPGDRTENPVFFDAELLPDHFLVRIWQPGDRIIPFGSENRVKLKKIFADNKTPAEQKHHLPLLCQPTGGIIWVPGIRRANFANITEKTEKLAKITFSRRYD